jgi:hypothetical protein
LAATTCAETEDCSDQHPDRRLVVSFLESTVGAIPCLHQNSVCIVSILRLNSLFVLAHNERDSMFYSAPPIYWAAIEMNLAIVCACVPALKPLVIHIIPTFASRRSGNDSSQRSDGSKVSKFVRPFQRLDGNDESRSKIRDLEQASAGSELRSITALPPIYRRNSIRDRIRVTHDVHQESNRRPSAN